MNIRRTAACLTSAAALSVTSVAMAQPASAAPLFTGGLVNVNVQDVDVDVLNESLNNNNVEILNDNEVNLAVAAQVIAQVCDAQVGVLAELVRTGESTCDASGGTLTFTQVA